MRNVLVIDDEQMILGLVEQVLQRMNFSVETAENGQAGIDKFDTGDFDLVITDICMPDTDGNQVVMHIRKSSRQHTPVVGMSGTPWELSNPMFDYILPKPFQVNNLLETAKLLTGNTL